MAQPCEQFKVSSRIADPRIQGAQHEKVYSTAWGQVGISTALRPPWLQPESIMQGLSFQQRLQAAQVAGQHIQLAQNALPCRYLDPAGGPPGRLHGAQLQLLLCLQQRWQQLASPLAARAADVSAQPGGCIELVSCIIQPAIGLGRDLTCISLQTAPDTMRLTVLCGTSSQCVMQAQATVRGELWHCPQVTTLTSGHGQLQGWPWHCDRRSEMPRLRLVL